MILPGEKSHQGVPTESLDSNDFEEWEIALEMAHELSEEYGTVNVIDFRPNDCFLVKYRDGTKEPYRVVRGNNWQTGFATARLGTQPNTPEWERSYHSDWDEYAPVSYIELLALWLQGNVIPLSEQTTYSRRDTGERINVK